ncbi:MAG: STAS domain-containing protein [Candidatus Competibacter sp.]|nr:STAS domain-containing protein [Candidatus Contendobacter sp.]MDS4068369.1 STAS domain-containing protein [Candidatus Competibacter sp.]
MLTVNVAKSGEMNEVLLTGELDGMTSPQLEQQLNGLIEAGERCFLIRLAPLALITSAGLRVFLGFAKKMHKLNGKMILCEMAPNVRGVFDTVGFSNIMTISATAAEGKALLQPEPAPAPPI